PPAPADPGGRWLGGDADRVWDGSGGTGSGGAAEKSASTAGRSGAPVPAAAAAPASASAATGAAVGRPGVPPGTGDVITPPTRQGPGLRAGSVDDNAAFADYL